MPMRSTSRPSFRAPIALGALASIAIQALCLGSRADGLPLSAPIFAPPSRTLGTYQVTGVKQSSRGSIIDRCAPTDGTNPNSHCSQYLWLVRNGSQLAVLEAQPEDDNSRSYATALLDGMFIHRKCDSFVDKDAAAQNGTFMGDFCRSFLSPRDSTPSSETFLFSSAVPELKKLPVLTTALDSFEIIFMALTVNESAFSISVPRGETSPKKIKITQTTQGTEALVFSSSIQFIYDLTLVQN